MLTGCNIYDSGCRADGSEAAIILLPSNITVFTLDFSGSGLSGGEHVTLGWNEVSACFIAILRNIISGCSLGYLAKLINSKIDGRMRHIIK